MHHRPWTDIAFNRQQNDKTSHLQTVNFNNVILQAVKI